MRLPESLATRLLLSFGTIILVFAAATILSMDRLSHFNASVSVVTGPQLERLERADEWLDALQQSAHLASTALIQADEYEMPDQIKAIESVDATAAEKMAELQAEGMSAQEQAALGHALAARAAYIPLEERVLALSAQGQIARARMVLLKEAQEPQQKYLAALRQLREVEERLMTASTAQLAETYRSSRMLLMLMLVATLVASGVLAYRNARAIRRPLARVIAHFNEISHGNLDGEILIDSGGEVGQVLTSLQATQRALRDAAARAKDYEAQVSAISRAQLTEQVRIKQALETAVREIQRVVQAAIEGSLAARVSHSSITGPIEALVTHVNALLDNLMHVVDRIKRATARVQSGANEIQQGSAYLSQRTEEQAASLEQSSATMHRMTEHVRTAADNADRARDLAIAAQERASAGRRIVGDAVAAMRDISTASHKIAEIIGVIDEIAFQTNLLALNAAVEAARAGEQGRGFAVVASEVRNLAGRSAAAAKEIKELITDGVRRIAHGEKLVEQSGHSLSEIGDAVERVTGAVTQIAEASQGQAHSIAEVSKAVAHMDNMTQQNAALVEQTSAATDAIIEQIAQLSSLVERYEVAEEGVPVAA